MKIGILVVAYNAETTLRAVLDRIPVDLRPGIAEVLVQDDSSSDRTYEVGVEAKHALGDMSLTVLRHESNLGYGGNQKAGYRYAIDHGWDVVVMLHGDGQYAPEIIDSIWGPIVAGDADVVMGSRMMQKGAALEGGMPYYKYVGNRILTRFQNKVTGAALSEWHSGYRAYRVSALADVAFEGNSDGFDFDTEIILQMLAAKKRLVEVPIPTYYGDEVCYVNGVAYAADVVADTLRYRLSTLGFGSARLAKVDDDYAHKPSERSSHGHLKRLCADTAGARVLDVGCGPGWVAEALRAQGNHVTGIDLRESDGVRERTDEFWLHDLDAGLPAGIEGRQFDLVVAADVLEHVRRPERLLAEIFEHLAPHGRVFVCIPNIGHWYPRARIASGFFDYDQRGILDHTHVRLFSRRSFRRLCRDLGLRCEPSAYIGLPFDVLLGPKADSRTGVAWRTVDHGLARVWPTMFAYQFVFEISAIV